MKSGKLLLHYAHLTAFLQDNLGNLAPEWQNHSGFYWSKKWWGGSGMSWTTRSRQITMPTPYKSVSMGRMLFWCPASGVKALDARKPEKRKNIVQSYWDADLSWTIFVPVLNDLLVPWLPPVWVTDKEKWTKTKMDVSRKIWCRWYSMESVVLSAKDDHGEKDLWKKGVKEWKRVVMWLDQMLIDVMVL